MYIPCFKIKRKTEEKKEDVTTFKRCACIARCSNNNGNVNPVLDYLTGSVGAIMPIGIGVFMIMTGLRLIPRIIRMFAK